MSAQSKEHRLATAGVLTEATHHSYNGMRERDKAVIASSTRGETRLHGNTREVERVRQVGKGVDARTAVIVGLRLRSHNLISFTNLSKFFAASINSDNSCSSVSKCPSYSARFRLSWQEANSRISALLSSVVCPMCQAFCRPSLINQ